MDEATNAFKTSHFTKSTIRQAQREAECTGVKMLFKNVNYKTSKQGAHILAVTFLYNFEDRVVKPKYSKLHRCINSTRAYHDEHVKMYNWLTSMPGLKARDGTIVKPRQALYNPSTTNCCQRDASCCPDKAMLVAEGQSSSCRKFENYVLQSHKNAICQQVATGLSISYSRNKFIKIRLVATCHLLQLVETTCRKPVGNKFS